MGLLIGNDSTIFRTYFKEMAKLLGITVKYQYPIDMEFSDYGEENPRGFSEFEDIDIIFSENPETKTLKKYGWFTEDSDRTYYTAQFAYDTKNLTKGCRVKIQSNLKDEGRLFVVTEIKANLEFPESWMCQLAPVFHNKIEENELKIDTHKTNNSFIKTK